jgi:hypothetical protein
VFDGATVFDGASVVVVVVTTGTLIVTDVDSKSVGGPVLEDASKTEPDFKRTRTVPSDVQVTVTTTDTFAVLAAGVALHPVAVPRNSKSPVAIAVTDSENVSV